MSDDITAFKIDVPESELDDLRRRLDGIRWPEAEPVDDWSQGVPLDYTLALCDYWRDDYDWRRCEASLNAFPQFLTTIDGLDVHFLHVRSPQPDAQPLPSDHTE